MIRLLLFSLTIITFCPLFVSAQTKMVDIREEHKACKKDLDCVGAMVTCSQCECYGEPVNSKYEPAYKLMREGRCKKIAPIGCTRNCEENMTFFCREEKCVLDVVIEQEGIQGMVRPEDYEPGKDDKYHQ